MELSRWLILGLMLIGGGAASVAQGQARFEPLTESMGAADAFRTLQQYLQNGKLTEAAGEVKILLQDRADDLTRQDETGLVSLATAVEQLLANHRDALTGEYRKLHDGRDAARIEALRRDRAARPEDFYLLARQYPLSGMAGAAYVEAADRAAALGDFMAASCFYALAKRHGGELDDARQAMWATCRMLEEGPGKGRGQSAYRGPLPYVATWYGQVDSVGLAKYFPYAVDGTVYFAGSRHLIAVDAGGQLLWRWTSADAWMRRFSPHRGREQGQGTPYTCAVFAGAAGAQIVVVRQPKPIGPDYCLRSFRATDGKLLWSTERMRAFDRLSFASSPAVAGRYVYAGAVDFERNPPALVILAADLLSGELIFKTALGNMLDMENQREQPPGWDDFWEQSEPAVAGDVLYLTPNVGVAYAVGRFDGKVRWMRVYDEKAGKVWTNRALPAPRRQPPRRIAPPTNVDQLLRWRGTPVACGAAVVIAPQDSNLAWGLDAATGRPLWTSGFAGSSCLVGGTKQLAFLAGETLTAINSATGRIVWRYEPGGTERISGPVVVAGGDIGVPTSGRTLITLAAETGQPIASNARIPTMQPLIVLPTVRKVLEEARILETIREPDKADPAQ